MGERVFVTGAGVIVPERPPERMTIEREVFAACVDSPDPDGRLPARRKRRMNRVGIMAAAAALRALDDAGIDADDCRDFGICVGTGLGCTQSMDDFFTQIVTADPALASPAIFPNGIPNAIASQVALLLRLGGPNATLSAREISGEIAIATAADWVRSGRASRVLAGGADELTANLVNYAAALGLGGPLAEGAAFLVLEGEKARSRAKAEVAEVRHFEAETGVFHGWLAAGAARAAAAVGGVVAEGTVTVEGRSSGGPAVCLTFVRP